MTDLLYHTKEEFQNNIFCGICLSSNRKLTQMGDLVTIYEKLLNSYEYINSYKELLICWECGAVLKKIIQFQNKVNVANALLMQQKQGSVVQPSLSTLNKTIILEETHKIIFNDDSVIKCEMNDIYEQTEDDSNEGAEFKNLIAKINKRKNKWAQIKAVLNKRPRFKKVPLLSSEISDLYFKLKISLEEMKDWLVREKRNHYYIKAIFKCDDCIKGFADEETYLKHIGLFHKKQTEYECDICNITLTTKQGLDSHRREHEHKYKCLICDHVCYKQTHIEMHIWDMHSQVYQCSLCDRQFWNTKEHSEHYKEMHETFVCDYCGVSFKMKYCLRNHIRKKHRPVMCEICNKTFNRYNSLWLHRKLKHSIGAQEKSYCVECDKHFDNIYSYKWHLNNSVKHKPKKKRSYPCAECDKIFTKNSYMKDHYDLVHLKKNKFQCERCHKNFIRNVDLMKHKRRVHDGVMPPKDKICYICGRGFTRNAILNNHIRTHTGERPFGCEYCAGKFAQKGSLNTHMKLVHRKKTISL